MSTQYLGFTNLLESAGTVSTSNEVSGFEKENAFDWLTFDWWKAGVTGTQYIQQILTTADTADYFAIAGHNLGSEGCTIKLYSSIDSGSNWVEQATKTPTSDIPIFLTFSSLSTDYWKVEISNCTVDAYISVVSFGDRLELPKGAKAGSMPIPYLAREYSYTQNISQGGHVLGGSLETKELKFTISQEVVVPSWIRSNWATLHNHLPRPFFYSWDYATNPDDVVLCYPDKKVMPAVYSHPNYMTFSIPVIAYYDI